MKLEVNLLTSSENLGNRIKCSTFILHIHYLQGTAENTKRKQLKRSIEINNHGLRYREIKGKRDLDDKVKLQSMTERVNSSLLA